jgi:hypothetical protein
MHALTLSSPGSPFAEKRALVCLALVVWAGRRPHLSGSLFGARSTLSPVVLGPDCSSLNGTVTPKIVGLWRNNDEIRTSFRYVVVVSFCLQP